MSGQTIEILNTDAEGRLVLADVLWYCQDRFKPKAMIDLATLTGAIMVALGKEHAGLFSNDDKLAERLLQAGLDTGEKLWRMPLDAAYDREIDSKNADVKNIGGQYGGAITAAQFLQRFVNDKAVGAPRHRRHRHGVEPQRDQRRLGVGLRRAAAEPVGRDRTTRGEGGCRCGTPGIRPCRRCHRKFAICANMIRSPIALSIFHNIYYARAN